LSAVIAGPQRSGASRARDGARHPAESLEFWGLQPGQTVVEISPGGGYWTEILAPYLKQTGGRYIATVSAKGAPKFLAKYAAPAFGKIEVASPAGPFAAPGSADLVLTARNIHNFMADGSLDLVLADAFAALKPGGVFAVEEHRADPRPMAPGATDGYVSTAFVIQAARKAGFTLDASSEINANPKDTKDHPFGVWTLPPTRQSAPDGQPANPAFGHAKYDAIGESDRMTLRFRKPA
jgi:predicted methyltransferase